MPSTQQLSTKRLLLCSAAVVTLSMGVRHGFGLWLQPMTMAHGWTRETFALAMAIQNLAWGAAGPLVGMWADRWGAPRILMVGAVCYALGLWSMANVVSDWGLALTAGVLIGIAQAGTTYAVVYGVIGRNIPEDRRSWAMGATAAAGSFGQFLMVPVDSWLINALGWQSSLHLLAGAMLLIIPLAFGLHEGPLPPPSSLRSSQAHLMSTKPLGALAALTQAWASRDFLLLTIGYFVCGFQVVFIGVHLPSYLRDYQLNPDVATTALALIGLFNVIGTYAAGVLGQRWAKRHILAGIYALRSITIIVFITNPLTPITVYIFAAAMGVLWLSTIPPTNAIVAQVFGGHHLSMLGGVVFFSHQIGSFCGVWLGGKLYDSTGSYQMVWWIAVALGVGAALINLPIRETPVRQPVPTTS